MSSKHEHKGMDRRTFLRVGSMGAIAAAAGAGAQETHGEIQYRTLGRTGLKVSVVSMGAMRTFEAAIMQAAFDRGVNYIDTARCYKNGLNEQVVGAALKGWRDKVTVATKCHMVTPQEDIIASVEESLKTMQIDCIDILQLHHPSPAETLHEDAKAALTKLREQGKIRFTGVTTHSDEVAVIDTVVTDPDKFYDMILVTYNFKDKEDKTAAIQRAAQAGLGVVAMKTQAGGYKTDTLGDVSPHQAALKWVLQHPGVHAAVPAMVNLDEVKEDTAVLRMDLKVSRAELEMLHRYDVATASRYCRRCNACSDTCPYGVDIATVNRSLMYAEGYRDVELACATYAEIPRAASLAACGACSVCTARCVCQVDIPSQIKRAQRLFC
ncbi:MAG TPA: hypothetical protein ENN80_08840 [Candidatus Hydrogenedentes bacterium]|nr:hypothetical protein [Candidatus Hydrogenedentota bacterium]